MRATPFFAAACESADNIIITGRDVVSKEYSGERLIFQCVAPFALKRAVLVVLTVASLLRWLSRRTLQDSILHYRSEDALTYM